MFCIPSKRNKSKILAAKINDADNIKPSKFTSISKIYGKGHSLRRANEEIVHNKYGIVPKGTLLILHKGHEFGTGGGVAISVPLIENKSIVGYYFIHVSAEIVGEVDESDEEYKKLYFFYDY